MSGKKAPETQPADYAEILGEAVGGERPVLIGGQNVNLWALLFIDSEPALANFEPFTSEDCDVVASLEWLRGVANRHGLQCKTFRAGQASPALGVIFIPMDDAKHNDLQVLRHVLGLHPNEPENNALEIELDGKAYRVIDPITCLKAKLANVLHLDQAERQDVKHVKILCLCVRAFLSYQLSCVRDRQISERICVDFLEAAVSILGSDSAKRVSQQHNIDFKQGIPSTELSAFSDGPIANFVKKRLPRQKF